MFKKRCTKSCFLCSAGILPAFDIMQAGSLRYTGKMGKLPYSINFLPCFIPNFHWNDWLIKKALLPKYSFQTSSAVRLSYMRRISVYAGKFLFPCSYTSLYRQRPFPLRPLITQGLPLSFIFICVLRDLCGELFLLPWKHLERRYTEH